MLCSQLVSIVPQWPQEKKISYLSFNCQNNGAVMVDILVTRYREEELYYILLYNKAQDSIIQDTGKNDNVG